MRKSTAFLSALLLSAAAASAVEHNRENIVIEKILPISGSRAYEPNTRNIIRVYIQATNWTGGCRTTAFDMKKEDTHLYAALLSGSASGSRLSVTVDDQLKPIDDVCLAVLIGVSP